MKKCTAAFVIAAAGLCFVGRAEEVKRVVTAELETSTATLKSENVQTTVATEAAAPATVRVAAVQRNVV